MRPLLHQTNPAVVPCEVSVFAPAVTPELAERCLIGAAIHALTVRARRTHQASDDDDLDFARRVAGPDELAESSTAYAICLVWWAHRDLPSRRALLESATALMLARVSDSSRERAFESGYRIFSERLRSAAFAPKVHARELDVRPLVSRVPEIDLMTARFAESAIDAVLASDRDSFGHPAIAAEAMRDRMISLAYLHQAA
jgi:hypothetical protein